MDEEISEKDNWCEQLCLHLRSLQQQYMFCDSVIISGDNDIFPLHTCVLVAVTCEKVLPEPAAKAPYYSLRLEHIPSKVVERLVSFFYSGWLDNEDLTLEEKRYLVASSKSLGIDKRMGDNAFGRLEKQAMGNVYENSTEVETTQKEDMTINDSLLLNGVTELWPTLHDEDILLHQHEKLLQNDEAFPAIDPCVFHDDPIDPSSLINSSDADDSMNEIKLEQLLRADDTEDFKTLGISAWTDLVTSASATASTETAPPKETTPQETNSNNACEKQPDQSEKEPSSKAQANDTKEHRPKRTVNWIKTKTKSQQNNFSYSQYVEEDEKIVEQGKRKYVCKQCGFTKTSMESFVVHKLKVHEGTVPFSCSKCSRGFYRKYDCTRHEERCSDKRKPSKAPRWERNQLPNKMLAKVISPGELVKQDSHRKFYKCLLCSKVVLTYETFVSHKFEHAKIRPFSCARCGQAFLRLSETRRHVFCAKSCKEVRDFKTDSTCLSEHKSNVINAQGVLIDVDKVQQAIHILSTEPAKHNEDDAKNDSSELFQYVEENEVSVQDGCQTFKCAQCGVSMTSLNSFAAHKMKHSNTFHYTCKYCNKGFRRKTALSKHLPSHLKNEASTCSTCCESFESKNELFTHMQTKQLCKAAWKTTSQDRHLSENGQSLPCKFCPKVFTCEEYLEKHIDLKHCRFVRPFRCNQCSISFRLETNYILHMEKHIDGQSSFRCASCGKTFERRMEFNSHILTHRRDFKCFNCNKVFKSVSSLKLHQALHTGLKPFLCKICGKSFTQKGNLVKHEQSTHAGDKTFRCSDCGKQFASDAGLRWHRKVTHHNSRCNYLCSVCGKAFPMRVTMQRHFLTHTDYKPFKCPVCSKFFRSKAHVKRHCKCTHKLSQDLIQSLLNFKGTENEQCLAIYATQPFSINPKLKACNSDEQPQSNHHSNQIDYITNGGSPDQFSGDQFSSDPPAGNPLSFSENFLNHIEDQPLNLSKTDDNGDSLSDILNMTTDFQSNQFADINLSDYDCQNISNSQSTEPNLFGQTDANGHVLFRVVGEDGSLHYVKMQPQLLLDPENFYTTLTRGISSSTQDTLINETLENWN